MTRRKTHEEFVAEVEALYGDEYMVLENYINNHTKIKVKHEDCMDIYDVRPKNLLRGDMCPKCNGNKKKTTKEFKQEVYELVGDEYEVVGEYVNNNSNIKMKHNLCGCVYEARRSNFISNHRRCPNCNKSKKKTTEKFKHEVQKLVGTEYTVLGDYVNNITKIKMKHNTCYHTYNVAPYAFTNGGNRCPKCNESKGERAVSEFLAKLYVPYIRQHKFEDCRNINRLPFDFAVFNADRSLNCLIEYDGEYHYKPMEHAGGLVGLKSRKHNDAIKTQYCADHNIPLIRIPYWEFDNIDEILTKELRKLGVIGTQDIAA